MMFLRARTSNRIRTLAVGLVCSGLALIVVRAQEQQKIQFSEPTQPLSAPATPAGTNQSAARAAAAKAAQEQMLKHLPAVHSMGPLEMDPNAARGYFVPRPTPDRRTLSNLEKQRNWAFNDGLNQNSTLPTLEEAAGIWEVGPDGRDKKSQTSIERYFYKDTSPKRSTDPVSLSESLAAGGRGDFSGTNAFNPNRPTSRMEEELRQRLGEAALGGDGASGRIGGLKPSFANSLLPPDYAPTPVDQRAEFQKLLDPHWVAPAMANPWAPNASAGIPNAAGGTGFNPAASPAATEYRPALGMAPNVAATPTFRAHVLDDLNAKALGVADPSTLPPPAPAPRPPAPIFPSTAFPKRTF